MQRRSSSALQIAIRGLRPAPHKGGEEEGIVCVSECDGTVQSAILSKGRITVFAKDPSYDKLMQRIQDLITQANSGHRDRMTQPIAADRQGRPPCSAHPS
jgi:hypothetical protein